ncbi:helix-turn-helix transcriptional regulator [Thauera sinica]|uniref:Helix-turn-helix transcriptional regulator n=1 Tax=Thauera sinica TaxID=2665146 RepID=A0ABW1AT14_9RHOO|nr:YafY family protein [Thauera sp. K11]ATE61359.1 DNA-binding transcriptional regulator [Thauera sp. K11]
MRPADRLFQIILMLRNGRVLTARALAEALEVSERTIYRDIADLIGSGAPIDGEAGVGYRLRRGYQVPPLMFTGDELEALVIGAKLVQSYADPALGKAAAQAMARIEAVLPRALEERIAGSEMRFCAPDFMHPAPLREPMTLLREGMEKGLKVQVRYRREDGEVSQRTLWPLGLVFWGRCWTLGAWCELRQGFRTFRVDRIEAVEMRAERFDDRYGHLWQGYLAAARGESVGGEPTAGR